MKWSHITLASIFWSFQKYDTKNGSDVHMKRDWVYDKSEKWYDMSPPPEV